MWVEFVVGSRPCSERFFSGYSGFLLSSKTNISKFPLDLDEDPPHGCATANSQLLIIIIYYVQPLDMSKCALCWLPAHFLRVQKLREKTIFKKIPHTFGALHTTILRARLLNHATPNSMHTTVAHFVLLVAFCRHCAVNMSAVSEASLGAITA